MLWEGLYGLQTIADRCWKLLKNLYTQDYYYVDKTLFIKELIDKKAEVNLFTRPRRFGKTLTLSMLKYYFEAAYDFRGK